MSGTDRLDARLRRFVKYSNERGFTFDEVARAAVQVEAYSLTDLVEWLAKARSEGLIDDVGFDALPGGAGVGPRRYRVARQQASQSEGERAVERCG